MVGSFSTVSGQPFTLETLALTDVSAGLHNLIFQGLATCDETAFLDNVSLVTGAVISVPEPSTWAMMLLGFTGLGFAAYRRARAEARIEEPNGTSVRVRQSGELTPRGVSLPKS